MPAAPMSLTPEQLDTLANEVDCKKCSGNGHLKTWNGMDWAVIVCERCEGFGVDPDARPLVSREDSAFASPDSVNDPQGL